MPSTCRADYRTDRFTGRAQPSLPLEAFASCGRGLLLETALSCQSPELSAWSPHGTATLASRTARIGLGNSGQYILSPCVSEPI